MKIFLLLSLLLLAACAGIPRPKEEQKAAAPVPIPEGYVKFLCQPNGWGPTPEAAIKDLRERILPWYVENYGHRPGFEVDWEWYALVHFSDGRLWQADGRLWWYAPKAKRPVTKPS